MKNTLKIYSFFLVLSGVNESTEGLEDNLYNAGCDDALISSRNGVVSLDFDREALSLQDAIQSAISDIEKVPFAKVNHIEGVYVTLSEIAEETNLTKQAISLLIKGERGPGNFPIPFCGMGSTSPIWELADVLSWMLDNGKIDDKQIVEDAHLIRALNNKLYNQGDHKSYM